MMIFRYLTNFDTGLWNIVNSTLVWLQGLQGPPSMPHLNLNSLKVNKKVTVEFGNNLCQVLGGEPFKTSWAFFVEKL